MKRVIRIAVDAAMLALYLYLMSYHGGRGLMDHALIGIATFILFILHHLLNLSWFKTLGKGKYRAKRIMLLALNVLLLAASLLKMVSAVMVSGMVFSFSAIPVSFGWVEIHYFSTAWGFLLMACHLGMHVDGLIGRLENRVKGKPATRALVAAAEVLLAAVGVYGIIRSGLYHDLALEPVSVAPMTPKVFYPVYLSIAALCCLVTHAILRVLLHNK